MSHSVVAPKKLVDVTFPLDAIYKAAAQVAMFSQLAQAPEGLWESATARYRANLRAEFREF